MKVVSIEGNMVTVECDDASEYSVGDEVDVEPAESEDEMESEDTGMETGVESARERVKNAMMKEE